MLKGKKFPYSPDSFDLVSWQDKTYHINQIFDLNNLRKRKKRFNESTKSKTFLNYRQKLYRTLQGIKIYLVDGNALRSGNKSGDADFTMGGHGYRYLYIPEGEIWIDSIYKNTLDLWPTIWHEYLEYYLMKDGINYTPAHDQALKLEIVLRTGDYFILPVGTHAQEYDWTCGPASLKIVLDYLDWPISEKYLARLCKTGKKKGTYPADLVRVAKDLTFKARMLNGLTISKTKKLIKSGVPVIANHTVDPNNPNIDEQGHYAVIIGYSKDEFVLSDPSQGGGYKLVPIAEFMKYWYEKADKTYKQGIIINA